MRRTAATLGAGIGGALLLDVLVPAAESTGLRGILVVAPIVVALLAAVARRIGAPAGSLEEGVGGALVVALFLGQDRLDLPQTERLAALLAFALVAWRIARLAPYLRRAMRLPSPVRRALFAAVPFAAYLVVLPWANAARPPNGDEPYYLLLAESLASDLDVNLSDEYRQEAWRGFGDRPIEPQPGDPVGPRGEIYSRHDPLLPLLLAPFWSVGGIAGARLFLLLISAGLASATLDACRALGVGERGALRAWALAAFAPPLVSLCYQVWVEVPAALLVAIALATMGRSWQEDGRWSARRIAVFTVALALLPMLKLRFLAVAAPLALLGLVGRRSRGGARLVAAGILGATIAGLLAVNAWMWGNPLRMHSLSELALLDVPVERFLRGGLGLGFDVAFGLFAAAPLWLLAVPGAARSPWRARPVALALAALVPYFVLVASRREWYGGWSPAFRYGFVALPAIAAAAGVFFDRRPRAGARILIAVLGGITMIRTAAVLVEPGWAFNLADGRASLLDAATADFAADVARFFPSAIRVRPATWIVPSLALALVALSLLWPRRRPRNAASIGIASLLLLWTGTVALGFTVPTRVVELEDPWVSKLGGQLWPNPWMFDRTRFDSGWLLRPGDAARIPVVRGSERAELTVRWRAVPGSAAGAGLEMRLGERAVAGLELDDGDDWRRDTVIVSDWSGDEPLELRYRVPAGRRPPEGVVVDRIELEWR